uniref:Cadherin N-terminal domain-containing protein n=1 Tax=Stegastes partitus TaxID=144197 RepID=A0A3B5AIL1_9TELE
HLKYIKEIKLCKEHKLWLSFSMLEALAQIRYSVPEEVQEGTVVGNIAKDLGLDIASLTDRRFRVVSESKNAIFGVNPDNGRTHRPSHIKAFVWHFAEDDAFDGRTGVV